MRLWLRLSLGLGIPVRLLQAQMSAGEFALYQAYYRLEPWGEERADLRNGILCAVLANIHRGKGGQTYKPSDFMPYAEHNRNRPDVPKGMSPHAMFGVLKVFSAARGVVVDNI